MNKKNTELETIPKNAVATPFNYGEDAGVGQDVTMDDLRLPLLILCQTESKVLIEGEAKFIPGGVPGMILNTATREYYPGDTGILLVPAVIKTSVIEWLPDNAGFVAEHDSNSEVAVNAKSNGNRRNGNELVKTKTMVAVRVNEDLEPIDFVVIPFSSSKLAAWSSYFTALTAAKATKNAPLFAQTIRLASFPDKNREGKRYQNYALFAARDAAGNVIDTTGVTNKTDMVKAVARSAIITSLISPAAPAYIAAKLLRDQVLSGAAKVDHSVNVVDNDEGERHF